MIDKPLPPKLPLHFFRWYCNPDYQEDIEGDLMERFERKVEEKGIRAARWGFFKDVLLLFRPGIIRPWEGSYQLNYYGIFKNLFKLSIRDLKRNKHYTALSITALSLAFACFYGVYVWTSYLSSIDSFHDEVQNIYGVVMHTESGNSNIKGLMAPLPAGKLLVDQIPSVKAATFTARHFDGFTVNVSYGNKSIYEENRVMVSDSSFFEVFSFPKIYGDPNSALKEPNLVVVSKTVSDKFFGKKQPLGEVMMIANKPYKVSAVIDVPYNSQLQFGYIISRTSFNQDHHYFHWESINFPLYLRLTENASLDQITKYLRSAVIKSNENQALQEFRKTSRFNLIPFKSIKYEHGFMFPPHFLVAKGLSKRMHMYLLITMATIMIIIAAVNFANLSIVQIKKNSASASVMRLYGSKLHIPGKLFIKASMIYLIASVMALFIVWKSIGYIDMTENSYFTTNLFTATNLIILFGIGLTLAFITTGTVGFIGHYLTSSRVSVHGWLIIFQFTVSVTIIVSTLYVFKQFNLLSHQNLGFNKDQVILIENTKLLGDDAMVMKQNILKHSAISNACLSNYIPSNTMGNNVLVNHSDSRKTHLFAQIIADSNFLDVYIPDILTGTDRLIGKNWCIINKAGQKELGGEGIEAGHTGLSFNGRIYEVKAILDNPLFEPLHFAPRPLIIYPYFNWGEKKLSTKVAHQNIEEALILLSEEWSKHSDTPFEYKFLDINFERIYANEKILSKILILFSSIAACISLFGLVAMVLNLIELRTKEIAIRKINGAKVEQIVFLMSKTFTRWLVISIICGEVISYIILKHWLQNFAHQTSLNWSVYFVIATSIMFVALTAVAFHTVKAGMDNPINSLRHE